DGLDDGAMVADGDVLQTLEMPLHQREGVEIADAIVEGGGTLEVREQQRDVPDADALARLDHLVAEEVAEGLRGEQALAGEERDEADGRLADLGTGRQDRKKERPPLGGGILHLEGDRAGRDATPRMLAHRLVEEDMRDLIGRRARALDG